MSAIRTVAGWLSKMEIWLVLGAVAVSFLSTCALPWAVLAAGVFWPLRWLASGRLTRRTPADWAIVGLLLMLPVTLWATALPEITIPQVWRLLSGIGLYYALVNASWLGHTRMRWLGLALAVTGLGLAAFAFVSVNWSITAKPPFIPARLYSFFPQLVTDTANPNVMGGSVVLLILAVSGLPLFAWHKLPWIDRLSYLAAGLMGSAVLLLTQSRGALLGLAGGLALLVILRWRWGWISILTLAVILVIGLQAIGATPLIEMLVSSSTLGGLDGRVEVWSRAIYMIQDFSFTGVGMGSYGRVADLLYPFFLAAPGKIEHAHNLLLQIGVDLGIPGLICWLAIWLLMVWTAWDVLRRGRELGNGLACGLGAGLLAAQVALMVHGMVDAVTWGMVRPAPIVWALWGLIVLSWYALHPSRPIGT